MTGKVLTAGDLLGPMIDWPAEARRLHMVYAMVHGDKRDAELMRYLARSRLQYLALGIDSPRVLAGHPIPRLPT